MKLLQYIADNLCRSSYMVVSSICLLNLHQVFVLELMSIPV